MNLRIYSSLKNQLDTCLSLSHFSKKLERFSSQFNPSTYFTFFSCFKVMSSSIYPLGKLLFLIEACLISVALELSQYLCITNTVFADNFFLSETKKVQTVICALSPMVIIISHLVKSSQNKIKFYINQNNRRYKQIQSESQVHPKKIISFLSCDWILPYNNDFQR